MNRNTLINFLLLVAVCSLYRIIPDRMAGFAPQIAMAIFAGSVIKDKKWSFLMPLLSMLVSDVLYEVLYQNGLTKIKGFYDGQLFNYILFIGLTVIGFYIKAEKKLSIVAGAIAAPVLFYIVSNFGVWISGSKDLFNVPYPKTLSGFISCYAAGLPFLAGSLAGTLIFSTLFFDTYLFFSKKNSTVTA